MKDEDAEAIQNKLRQERKPARLKRFYKKASLKPVKGGWLVLLDGKELKTPAKNTLLITSEPLAKAIVDEWNGQGEYIEPDSMPLTKYANTALDRVAPRRGAIIDEIVAFASSDLVCYRADTPQGLVDMQSALWNPVLDWAQKTHNLGFVCVAGIIYATQPEITLVGLYNLLEQETDSALNAIYNLTTLTGSALIALAVCHGAIQADFAWQAAHADEDWNIRQWGSDADAAERRALRRAEFDGILAYHGLAKA